MVGVASGNGSPGFNFNNGQELGSSDKKQGSNMGDRKGGGGAGGPGVNGPVFVMGLDLNATFSGAIAGTGSVTKAGSGVLALGSALNGDGEPSLLDQANKARLAGDQEKAKQLMERYDSLTEEGRHRLGEEQAALEGGKDGGQKSGEKIPALASPAQRAAKPYPPQAKPVETWKPAHVVPNSSRLMVGDKEELPLKGMQVDVRVDGFRARVLIDLYYFNDRPQQLEGNFQLRLPDEAAPYFFAFGRTVYQAPQVTAADSMFFKPQQVSQGDTTPEKILALARQ